MLQGQWASSKFPSFGSRPSSKNGLSSGAQGSGLRGKGSGFRVGGLSVGIFRGRASVEGSSFGVAIGFSVVGLGYKAHAKLPLLWGVGLICSTLVI